MYKKYEQIYFSPSDLSNYMRSRFSSWMDRLSIESISKDRIRDCKDEFTTMLSEKGYEHEKTAEKYFKNKKLSILKIEDNSISERFKKTKAAMNVGVDVIAQGRLEYKSFAGYSDFLVKVNGASFLGDFHYEVWDAKLFLKIKPSSIIQLCCYSDMLKKIQGISSKNLTIILGNGLIKKIKIKDYYCYYKIIKKSFLKYHINFKNNIKLNPGDYDNWGNWSTYAKEILLKNDDLLQVANIKRDQINKLNRVGIKTMRELSELKFKTILNLNNNILDRLILQAKMQTKTKDKRIDNEFASPCFKIINKNNEEKSGLSLLPDSSKLDLFFDIEGSPFYKFNIEYLWGCLYIDEYGLKVFKDFWAHNEKEEKCIFQEFINFVYELWKKDPLMHIYHYANYEIAACRRLLLKYNVCDHKINELIDNNVFVDLYKVVKSSLIFGEDSYSIKNIELLYKKKRNSKVFDALGSVVEYEKWKKLNEIGIEGRTWKTSEILNGIRNYNIDDCNSTKELYDWLQKKKLKYNIKYFNKANIINNEKKNKDTELNDLRDSLLLRSVLEEKYDKDLALLTKNLAFMLDFHKRESKALFSRLFERIKANHIELINDIDCIAYCERTKRGKFKYNNSKYFSYEYKFDINQEFRRNIRQLYISNLSSCSDDLIRASFIENESNLEDGLIVIQSIFEPANIISLFRDEYIDSNLISMAIYKSVYEYKNETLIKNNSAIFYFLRRYSPRFKNGYKLLNDDKANINQLKKNIINEIINAILNLDLSYLTIQGPPGTGKSYIATRAISKLIESGYKIGISSNSHKAIDNLLFNTARYCDKKNIYANFFSTNQINKNLANSNVSVIKNNELIKYSKKKHVLGATVWGFARGEMEKKLDYIFIDEAGQVSVANLIAIARSTNNIILIGDQMQLNQPLRALHPLDSGFSIFDYLLREQFTISNNLGFFLNITYRMHSKITNFISDYFYDYKLKSNKLNDYNLIKVPNGYVGPINKEAGIVFVPVNKKQSKTDSLYHEAEKIKDIAESLIGRVLLSGIDNNQKKIINLNDMLFIAPFNHQVNRMKNLFKNKIKVGSIDKFQGQESPIVFISTCTNHLIRYDKSIEFIFNQNRINVAISRAQILAIVIGNPNISFSCTNIKQMRLINLFHAISMT